MIFSPEYLEPAGAAVARSGEAVAEEDDEKQNAAFRFTDAVTLMRKCKNNEARIILETLLAQDDEKNLDKYHFTLAHALLVLNDPSSALGHLRSTGGEFRAKALELIEQIED